MKHLLDQFKYWAWELLKAYKWYLVAAGVGLVAGVLL